MKFLWHAVPWPEKSLLAFLRRAHGQPRFFWRAGKTPHALAAFGLSASAQAEGPNRFARLQALAETWFQGLIFWKNDREDAPPEWVHPYLLVGLAFGDTLGTNDLWGGFPAGGLYLPRYLLLRREERTWLVLTTPWEDTEPQEQAAARLQEALWNIPAPVSLPSAAPQLVRSQDFPGRDVWEAGVQAAIERIQRGELHKVVLSRRRKLYTSAPIDPLTALDRLRMRYPACIRFLYEPLPGAAFFGATPETLATISAEGHIETMALAGSLRRGATFEEDQALGEQLLASSKDRHEHRLVVEAIREALSPLTRWLDVPTTPQLKPLSNIQHLYTPIRGQLRAGVKPLEVAAALHPTPAVGGTPRAAALDFIAHSPEGTPRGWYAAPIGWLSAQGAASFSVALRCALTRGTETCLFAGAGIVADSKPTAEWRETALKFHPVQQALAR